MLQQDQALGKGLFDWGKDVTDMARLIERALWAGLASCVVLAGTALAAERPTSRERGCDMKWKAQVRAINVNPNDSSGAVTGIAGSGIGSNSDTTVDLSLRYLFHKSLGVELTLLDSRHDLSGKGSIAALGKIAETRILPPTLTLVYVFLTEECTRPYVGLGLSAVNFHGENSTAALDAALGGLSTVQLADKAAVAAQLGCDFDLNNRWFLNLDLKYIWIDTTATVTTRAAVRTVDIRLNPVIFGGGAGIRF